MADQSGDNDLRRLEREAETARARLQQTIADIKDPKTVENAKREAADQAEKLKDQVVSYIREAKDNALGNMRDTSTRQTSEFSRKLQRTAIENPIPVLLIGAGIGWHLYRKPPVTTALLAAGIYGLAKNWNGAADEHAWRDPYAADAPRGYVPGGVAGYGYDEVSDVAGAADAVKQAATRASYQAENAVADARGAIGAARDSATGAAANVKDSLREAGENLVSQISDKYSAASDKVQDLVKTATDRVQPALDRVQPAVDAVRPAMDRVKPLFDESHRGQLGMLMVLAGAGAFAGGLLRSTETGRRWTEQARDSLRDNWDSLSERAGDIHPEEWRERAAQLPARVAGTARATASRVAETASHMRDSTGARASALRDRGADFTRTARDTGAEHPLLLSAIGLAVGAVLGGVIRQSAMENRTFADAGRALKEGAGDALREGVREVTARASGFAEGLRDATVGAPQTDPAKLAEEARVKRVSA
ncbi:MAG: hypothetical protein JWL62_2257 [Hyphomicrobiales bacterium]|nr:hypothetical protein [Hyphomicrobiales bacterium]